MSAVETLETAILEAELICARRDGVHMLRNCLCSLNLLRDFAEAGLWNQDSQTCLEQTMQRMRRIDVTGFAPRA